MGYDMYVVEAIDEETDELQALEKERANKAVAFKKDHPLTPLMQDQYKQLKKLADKKSKQTTKVLLKLDKEIEELKKAYQENATAYYEQEKRALSDIDKKIQDIETKTYFRLNIWGMSQYRTIMLKLGMMIEPTNSQSNGFYSYPQGFPGFKDAKEFGLSDEELDQCEEDYYDNPFDCPNQKYQNYRKASEETRSWYHSDAGMNIHKFSSNDGWLITPEEIKSALETYDLAIKKYPNVVHKLFADFFEQSQGTIATAEDIQAQVDYWNSWIKFLNNAAKSKGFTVY